MDKTFTIDDLRNEFGGIIFDTDILIYLNDPRKPKKYDLNTVLNIFSSNGIKMYYPEAYEKEWKSGIRKLKELRESSKLLTIDHDYGSKKVYQQLEKYPFDDGELNAYSLADSNKIAVASNDILPKMCYITHKKEKELIYYHSNIESFLNLFHNSAVASYTNLIPVFDFDNLQKFLADKRITYTPHKRDLLKPKDWASKRKNMFFAKTLFPVDCIKNHEKAIEKTYKTIGKFFSGLWACNSEMARNDSNNIGLMVKSTTHEKYNPLFAEKIFYKKNLKPSWKYSPLAFDALRKYFKTCPFLYKYVKNNFIERPCMGELKKMKDLEDAQKYANRFRKLYNKFRIKD